MAKAARFSRLELKVLEALWARSPLAIREMQETFPAARRPAYTTVQTIVYRLEAKGAVRRVRKIGNAHVFEAAVARGAAHRRLMDEFLGIFGGRTQPVMAHWIESGQLTLEDLKAAEDELRRYQRSGEASAWGGGPMPGETKRDARRTRGPQRASLAGMDSRAGARASQKEKKS